MANFSFQTTNVNKKQAAMFKELLIYFSFS